MCQQDSSRYLPHSDAVIAHSVPCYSENIAWDAFIVLPALRFISFWSCFIIDRGDFLVIHEVFLQNTKKPKVERIHMTVKEPYTAEDFIARRFRTSTKTACVNFAWGLAGSVLLDCEFCLYSGCAQSLLHKPTHFKIQNYPKKEKFFNCDGVHTKWTWSGYVRIRAARGDEQQCILANQENPGSKLAYCTCPSESVSSTFASVYGLSHMVVRNQNLKSMCEVSMFNFFVCYI